MGWAVAGSALADGVALDGAAVADHALALQADSASPTPKPTTEMPAILVVRMKCRNLVSISSCDNAIAVKGNCAFIGALSFRSDRFSLQTARVIKQSRS
jgi:hypothetical protein